MQTQGLAALAATYGLERAELQRLKYVAENFFDDLREELSRSLAVSFRLSELKQIVTSAGELGNSVPACQIVMLAAHRGPAALIKVDQNFARAFVDCALAGGASAPSAALKMTSVEERVLANTLGHACLRSAERTVAKILEPAERLRLVRAAETPHNKMFDPSERIVTARLVCRFGSGSGSIELGLPVEHLDKVGTRLLPSPAQVRSVDASVQLVRSTLAAARADLVAVLGKVMMPLATVRALAPGAVLVLQPIQNGTPSVELAWAERKLGAGTVVEHRGWRHFLLQTTGGSDE